MVKGIGGVSPQRDFNNNIIKHSLPSLHWTVKGINIPVTRSISEKIPVDLLEKMQQETIKLIEFYQQNPSDAKALEEHLTLVKKILFQARNLLNQRPEQTLILGAGSLMDIPLEIFQETLRKIVLVDLDETVLKNGLEKLTPDCLRKTEVFITDLSGIDMDIFYRKLEEPFHNKSDYERALEIAPFLLEMPLVNLPFEEKSFDLILSSQLLPYLSYFGFRVIEHQFGQDILGPFREIGWFGDEDIIKMVAVDQSFSQRVFEHHARGILRMLRPEGRAAIIGIYDNVCREYDPFNYMHDTEHRPNYPQGQKLSDMFKSMNRGSLLINEEFSQPGSLAEGIIIADT